MFNYDFTIIGAGPSGLTLAYILGSLGKKCLIIDKNNNVGGCHRVLRVDGLFTEHGPRVYSNSYVNTIYLLKKMCINFCDVFTPYKFNISNIGGKSITNLQFTEIFKLGFDFFRNSLDNKIISMNQYMTKHNFSNKSKDYINRLCLLTDGASADKYTLFQFLELVNQQFLYKLYQPKTPNDITLFPLIVKALNDTSNVTILLNTEVSKLNITDNKINSIDLISGNNYTTLTSSNFILAISPKDIIKVTKNMPNIFGPNTELISLYSSYNNNIPIIFHWNYKINLEKIWGFPKSNWGIAFIILSDYMNFSDDRSKTVISTCITLPNDLSTFLNKTSNQVTDTNELITEVFRQLKESFPSLPSPTYSILSPTVYRNNNEWLDTDSAFVRTNDNLLLPTHGIISNLYNVGTQNGNSPYNFTSFESAISNAISFCNNIIPESKKHFKLQYPYSLRHIILISITFVIIVTLIIYILQSN